jgi:hypothetical protein
MITRISKIARLPKTIREQLNHRLDNGEFGKTILPWLNGLPGNQTRPRRTFRRQTHHPPKPL